MQKINENVKDNVDSHVSPDDTQGGMLKTRLVDLVNLNCMCIPTCEDVMCMVCDTIDDYIKPTV
jgi:hypothetical protein